MTCTCLTPPKQDAVSSSWCVALGLRDFGVEAHEGPWARSVQTTGDPLCFIKQCTAEKPQIKTDCPLLLQHFCVCFTVQESGTTPLLFQKCLKELLVPFACVQYNPDPAGIQTPRIGGFNFFGLPITAWI